MKLLRSLSLLAVLAACSQDQTGSTTLLPVEPSATFNFERSAAGQIYTLDNASTGNNVLVFDRGKDGSLTAAGKYATNGNGSGGGLGNQGAVTLHEYLPLLFAVSAGSNEVSAFFVKRDGSLSLLSTVPSGGTTPVSVTSHGGLVYVLNAGGQGNITGFRLGYGAKLAPIPNSTRPLSSNAAGAAQISFARNGRVLVVTEKATNNLVSYSLNHHGQPSGPIVTASNGQTPFGFAVLGGGDQRVVVSEAFGGAPGASAASSYKIRNDGSLDVVSGTVGTGQSAACWVVVTDNNRYAYTTNTASNNISAYRVSGNGSLSLLEGGISATTGAGPIDAALSKGSRFMYVLTNAGQIQGFSIEAGGSLDAIGGDITGLPAGTNGLAAR